MLEQATTNVKGVGERFRGERYQVPKELPAKMLTRYDYE
jgi:hypothetical protein